LNSDWDERSDNLTTTSDVSSSVVGLLVTGEDKVRDIDSFGARGLQKGLAEEMIAQREDHC
jgi:hypothetical protein